MSIEKRKLFEEINDKAYHLSKNGKEDEAVLWYAKGMDVALHLHTFDEDLSAYKDIEYHYKNDPDYDQTYWDLTNQIQYFSNYAISLGILGDLDKALEITEIAESFLKKTDFFRPYRGDLYHLGNVYFMRKEFDKAIELYEKSLINYHLDTANQDGIVIAFAFIRKGLCHLYLQDDINAEQCFIKGEEVAKLNSTGKNFLIYYFLYQFFKQKDDEKQAKKYQKMYLTRLKKEDENSLFEQFEKNFIPEAERIQILADFHQK